MIVLCWTHAWQMARGLEHNKIPQMIKCNVHSVLYSCCRLMLVTFRKKMMKTYSVKGADSVIDQS